MCYEGNDNDDDDDSRIMGMRKKLLENNDEGGDEFDKILIFPALRIFFHVNLMLITMICMHVY